MSLEEPNLTRRRLKRYVYGRKGTRFHMTIARAESVLAPAMPIADAAQRLGVSPDAVMRLISAGDLVASHGAVTRASISRLKRQIARLRDDLSGPPGADDDPMTAEELELLRRGRPGRLPWVNG